MNCGRTRVSGQESREVWVWAAVEATSKIVPVIQLGPRTLEMAALRAVVHELRHRMHLGWPLPVFSSDRLRLYYYALTAHFGHWILPEGGHKRLWQIATDFMYGQVKKLQRRRRRVKVERVMLWGSFEALASRLRAAGLSGRINTAFIERLNLTLRQGVAPIDGSRSSRLPLVLTGGGSSYSQVGDATHPGDRSLPEKCPQLILATCGPVQELQRIINYG